MPGFGVFGILGIIGVTGSIIAASISLKHGLISITISFIVSVVLIIYLFKNLSRSKFFDRIILTLTQERDKGYKAGVEELEGLEGRTGLTLTPLKPTGSADIEGRRYDVMSEGGFIDANKKIRIVKVEGHKIFVREENIQ
jgi:membrane-bound serine protease (ClpP class)